MTTPSRLLSVDREREALRALSEAATPGEWWAERGGWVQPEGLDEPVAKALGQPGAQKDADAAFIVAAVNYVRAALSSPETTPAGVLDEAWAAAEKALPEGWWVHALYAWSFDDMAYRAEAASPGRQVDMSHSASTKRHGTKRFVSGASAEGYGPTPAAALHALAATLGRSGSGGGRG